MKGVIVRVFCTHPSIRPTGGCSSMNKVDHPRTEYFCTTLLDYKYEV